MRPAGAAARRGARLALALACALAAAPGALAAQPAQAAPAAKGAGGPAADSAALALLERTAKAYQGARTLRAEFTQALVNPRTRTDLRSRGEFLQQGSAKFAFRFSEPPEDRIVSDGSVLWLYSPSTAKGQVLKMPRAAGAGLDLVTAVLREPAKRFTVTALGDTSLDGNGVRAMRLVPRAQGGPFQRAVVWLDLKSALVRKAEFTEASGLVRTVTFTRIRTGAALPKDAFTFTPPAGVRVIDQAALLGGSAKP